MLRIFVFLLLIAGIEGACAQSGDRDETYRRILANRDAFQRVVHMRGDSILRGYALHFFADTATVEQRKDPRWDFRSPASTFNKFAPPGVVAAYAGGTGQPDSFAVEDVEQELRQQLKDDIIRRGDVVMLEDAGLQYGSPREYLKNWRRLRHVFVGTGVTLVFMTIADRIRTEELGGVSANLYRFSVPFDGLSHNDATRIAAENDVLIDFSRIVNKAEVEFRKPIQDDGIHITVEGQCMLVQALFDKLKIQPTGSCDLDKPLTVAAPSGPTH